MPWRFDKLAINPERIGAMQAAYYKACAQLGLSPTSDRITEILVTKIVELCISGECEPDRLCEAAVAYVRADTSLIDRSKA
jgi:hypothetical protein